METIQLVLKQIADKPKNDSLKFIPKIPYLEIHDENERIKQIVLPQLSSIETEIVDLLFNKIKSCKTLEDPSQYFDLLEKIYSPIAMLFFKEHIEISDKLRRFIRDFDRIDDPWLRKQLYETIQNCSYNYNFMRD